MDDEDLSPAERARPIRRHIRQLNRRRGEEDTRGYVIYRTTYTPESASAFPRIMEVLESYIKAEIDRELESSRRKIENPDLTPNNEVSARYVPVIMDDPCFDGASIDSVRAHFESWVEGRNKRDRWNMYRMCMVIDDEVFQLLKDMPYTEESDLDALDKWYVKLVEPWADIPNGPPDYEGWIKWSIFLLYRFWDLMDDGAEMSDYFGDEIYACSICVSGPLLTRRLDKFAFNPS